VTTANDVIAAALDLVWAQWSELGVPGVRTGPADLVVSPVDLLLFTPAIVGDRDERLTALVLEWCATHGPRVFGSRELQVRAAAIPDPARASLESWFEEINEVAPGPWPKTAAAGRAVASRTLGDEIPFRPDRRAAVHLRARALFGVGLRADLACALLAAEAEARALTTPDLAHLGYSSRAAQTAVSAFESAGVVQGQRQRRTVRYTLTEPGALALLLDAEDLTWFPWHRALPIVYQLVALAAYPSHDARVQRVRAHAVAASLVDPVAAIHGLPRVPVRPGDDDAAERLLVWGSEAIRWFGSRGR
jgi:hypothetical protein